MSIKKALVDSLKSDFLYSSDKFKNIRICREELCKKMVNALKEYSIRDISNQDLENLEKCTQFWGKIYICPGKSFWCKFGGKLIDPQLEMSYSSYSVNVSHSFYSTYTKDGLLLELPGELLEQLVELNNKILDLDYLRNSLEKSWNRLINKDTKRVWLKINFPEIYNKLRYYEKDNIPV